LINSWDLFKPMKKGSTGKKKSHWNKFLLQRFVSKIRKKNKKCVKEDKDKDMDVDKAVAVVEGEEEVGVIVSITKRERSSIKRTRARK